MPIRVEEFTSEVTIASQQPGIPPAELERIVRIVMRRIEEEQRAAAGRRDAGRYRASRLPEATR